jgi:hypothetical protein
MYPHGRHIFYEGDDPERFAAEIVAEFGFDPSRDPDWGNGCMFHCPAEHLDTIYSSHRWPTGS